jgi:hypothetical protein
MRAVRVPSFPLDHRTLPSYHIPLPRTANSCLSHSIFLKRFFPFAKCLYSKIVRDVSFHSLSLYARTCKQIYAESYTCADTNEGSLVNC